MPNWFVVCMGIGVVFVGLISIIIICSIMSLFFKNKKVENTQVNTPSAPAQLENRGEIIAAVSAAVAEELGTDVSGIRILSFKKL